MNFDTKYLVFFVLNAIIYYFGSRWIVHNVTIHHFLLTYVIDCVRINRTRQWFIGVSAKCLDVFTLAKKITPKEKISKHRCIIITWVYLDKQGSCTSIAKYYNTNISFLYNWRLIGDLSLITDIRSNTLISCRYVTV